MQRRGFTHNGRPSMSALARAAGLSIETVRRLVYGMGAAEADTILKVGGVLGSVEEVARWAGREFAGGPYQPPANSARLTERQRRALDELINAFTDERGGSDAGNSGDNTAGPGGDDGGDLGDNVIPLSDPAITVPERRVASRRDVKPEDEDPDTP